MRTVLVLAALLPAEPLLKRILMMTKWVRSIQLWLGIVVVTMGSPAGAVLFGTNLILNPSFEHGDLVYWTIESGNPEVVGCPVDENISSCVWDGGSSVLAAGYVPDPSIVSTISQVISVADSSSIIDLGIVPFALSGCFGNDPGPPGGDPDDDIFLTMTFLSRSGETVGTEVVIGEPGGNEFFCGDNPDPGNTASGSLPIGTRFIKIAVTGMIVPPSAAMAGLATSKTANAPNVMRTNFFTEFISYTKGYQTGLVQKSTFTLLVMMRRHSNKQGRQESENIRLQECNKKFQTTKQRRAANTDRHRDPP
jgi:hypothetical protein